METRSPSGGGGPRNPKAGYKTVNRRPDEKKGERAYRILVADRDRMSSHLIATAIAGERFSTAYAIPSADLLRQLETEGADLVVLGAETNKRTGNDFGMAQTIKRAHPDMPIVLLLNQSTHDSVVNAFRCGAMGVCSRQEPIAGLLDCVRQVRKGFIWAGVQETTFLLDAIRSLPFPNFSSPGKSPPLTLREKQVIQCAARGKSNKMISTELALSEHTVKNYLYRAFQKLGVSNRVELLFYLSTMGRDSTSAEHGKRTDPKGEI
jgi:two-component system, NarL family, nitrate/nitrite response regulator NarL